MGTDEREAIQQEIAELRADVKFCISYMRELATIMGARARLKALDDEYDARVADKEGITTP
jgi:division protein CdvB (Snf7/Vps24/ESCRT-III family)